MIIVTQHTNSECLACGKVEKNMVKIGAFVMCEEHWKSEFKEVGMFGTNSEMYKEKYLHWMKKYQDSNT